MVALVEVWFAHDLSFLRFACRSPLEQLTTSRKLQYKCTQGNQSTYLATNCYQMI